MKIFTLIIAFIFSAPILFLSAEQPKNGELRSAYLDNPWSQSELSKLELDRQLQNHFDAVIEILEGQTDVSLNKAMHLIDAQNAKTPRERALIRAELANERQLRIQRLKFYRQRCVFPQNNGQAEDATPIFVDDHGTHCAVGYLMHQSGNDDAVAKIVATNNLVYVNNVSTGPLVDWIADRHLEIS